jgi:hypothetical protein
MKLQFIICLVFALTCGCGAKDNTAVSTNIPLGDDSHSLAALNGVFEVVKITEEHRTCSSEGKPVSIPTLRYYEFQTESKDQDWKLKRRLCKDASCNDYWSYDPDGATWNSEGFWAYPISTYGCGRVSEVNSKIFLQFTQKEIVETQSGLNLETKRYRLEFEEFDCSRMRSFITEHQKEFLCHSKINVEEYRRVQ